MPAKRTILAALTLTLLSGATAQKATTVRLGFFPNLTHAPALIGIEKGYFKAAFGNTKLETKDFVSGTTLTEAFAAGQIDIGYVGPGPAINAAARGMPVQVIANAANAGAVLIARKDAGIKTFKDLAGKKVAVPSLGNTQDISLRHLLVENGLKTKDAGGNVTITPVAPADVAAAFASKQIDATLVPEPWGALLQKQGHVLVGDEKTIWRGGDYPTAVVIVNAKFAQENPNLVQAFLKAHLQAITLLSKNPPAAQLAVSAQLQKLTNQKVDPRVLQLALKRTKFTADLNLDAFREYGDLNKEAGYARTLPDFSTLVNLAPLKSARGK
ncbi:ABC transporter substrate-binding protein [Deinococcus maricopensis]|uniref:Aliphatic sulfonates family ABC transporter, periplasmic ligand-binding protein n=1 Tax=Deinococcus maricopensis (strain DSM 21211 / LMG 22137 / NRRL B-23946 / LB-34) TaxID=709986 RepID=E8U941_DEIML|nr:ABC transporter substrate-binding protein [Deinococcus maricopensis]ADV67580.1 aliphatic sulfonates family ABC transporter, periplasmic ligand-binding protein [Deinococcus maricopensis DSM 21211]